MFKATKNLLGSKHVAVIKKDLVFHGLHVAFTSKRAGVYISIAIFTLLLCWIKCSSVKVKLSLYRPR